MKALLLSLLSTLSLASEVNNAVLLAQRDRMQLCCLACLEERDIDNVMWAFYDLKYRGVCNPALLPNHILLEYGRRFHNSKRKCHSCKHRCKRAESQ
jgi:hypothetical protein